MPILLKDKRPVTNIDQIKQGLYGKYKNSWAYITGIHGNDVWLSGWHGIKTTVTKIENITHLATRQEIE